MTKQDLEILFVLTINVVMTQIMSQIIMRRHLVTSGSYLVQSQLFSVGDSLEYY